MGKQLASALIVVMMVAGPAAAEDREPNPWKPIFFTSLALTIAATAFTGLSQVTMKSEANEIEATRVDGGPITEEDCNDRSVLVGGGDEHFDSACAWRSRTRTGMMLTIGFGVATLASAYFAFSGGDDAAPSSKISIAPTFSASSAGAALRVRW